MLFETNQRERQEYIINSNKKNEKLNTDIYAKGNLQKVELDKKLEEISDKSNIIISGVAVRKNIINSTKSRQTTSSYVVDADNYSKKQATGQYAKNYAYNINRGKDFKDEIRNKNIQQSNNIFKKNNFN